MWLGVRSVTTRTNTKFVKSDQFNESLHSAVSFSHRNKFEAFEEKSEFGIPVMNMQKYVVEMHKK